MMSNCVLCKHTQNKTLISRLFYKKIINTLFTGQINEFIFVCSNWVNTCNNTVSFKQQKKTFTSFYFLMQKVKKYKK